MGIRNLPDNLETAVNKLENSDLAKEFLGDHVFREFIALKRKEWDQYLNTVHDWELKNYQRKF